MVSQDQVLRFPLINTLSRQIFEYNTGGVDILMMYDSGAQIPVWCRGEALLLKAYPDAKKTDYYCEISGFGKETERCDVYVIPLFELVRDNISFQIKNLFVANLFKPFVGCDLLLSETMFSKTDTLTIRRGKRELQISYDNKERPFICTAIARKMEAREIMVWSQSNEEVTDHDKL